LTDSRGNLASVASSSGTTNGDGDIGSEARRLCGACDGVSALRVVPVLAQADKQTISNKEAIRVIGSSRS
jgi:hypothetical protein